MKPIEEYAELFERLGLTELYVEEDGCRLRLKKDTGLKQSPMPAGFPGAPATMPGMMTAGMPFPAPMQGALMNAAEAKPAEAASSEGKSAERKAEEAKASEATTVPAGDTVKAPLLGIFHPSAGGTERTVGDRVKKGEAICTIEAMKMMNEVAAPRDGVIRAILPKDGALVEFDQDLVVLM